MVANSTQAIYAPMSSVDSATLTGSYIPLGSKFLQPARIIKLVNNSTVLVTVSTDGVTDMDVLPAGSFFLYDLGTNRGNSSPELCFPPVQFYVNGTAGTGLVYAVEVLAYTKNPGIPL